MGQIPTLGIDLVLSCIGYLMPIKLLVDVVVEFLKYDERYLDVVDADAVEVVFVV